MKLTAMLPLVAFGLALTVVVKTNDQQAQQTFINAAIGALAVRAGSSPNRRSDLQLHYGALATRESIVRKRVLSIDCTSRVSARIAA
jgi:hypothetical protein